MAGPNTLQQTVPVNGNGRLRVALEEGDVTLTTSDIEIGAVEIKDATTTNRVTVDSSGRLSILDGSSQSVRSSNNSIDTTIGTGSNWTGTADDLTGYVALTYNIVVVSPAQAAVTTYFEFSDDGTTWDVSVGDNIAGLPYVLPLPLAVIAKYFRARVTNEQGAPVHVRTYTMLHKTAPPDLTQLPSQAISATTPLKNVRAIAAGQAPDGTYQNVSLGGISVVNSSSTLLGANGVYTGTFEDAEDYSAIGVLVNTDVASAASGLELQWSSNGTTVDRSVPFSVTGGQSFFTGQPVEAKYFRVKYTNAGTAQATFHLQTQYDSNPLGLPMVTYATVPTDASLAQMSLAALTGKKPNGTYTNADYSANGHLRVAIDEHEVDTPLKALTNWQTKQVTLNSASSTQIDTSPLTGRKTISVRAISTNTKVVYVGPTSAVSASNGYELAAAAAVDLELDTTGQVWGISSTGSQIVAVAEIG